MSKYKDEYLDEFNKDHCLSQRVVSFLENGLIICNYLEK